MPITPDTDTEDERRRPYAADDEIPANPPPEVLDAIAAAAESCRALMARGHELVFTSTPGQRVSIELRGRDDQILNILTPSDVLDVATRGSPR